MLIFDTLSFKKIKYSLKIIMERLFQNFWNVKSSISNKIKINLCLFLNKIIHSVSCVIIHNFKWITTIAIFCYFSIYNLCINNYHKIIRQLFVTEVFKPWLLCSNALRLHTRLTELDWPSCLLCLAFYMADECSDWWMFMALPFRNLYKNKHFVYCTVLFL